ncbi:MAG: ornithine carbamoyltransferase [Candidatus Bipolaricaulota bacterium]
MKSCHLVTIADLSAEEIWEVLDLARELKSDLKSGKTHAVLSEKTLAMIFLKPSLRTRVSFEVGMTQLGGHAIYLGPNDIKLGERETTEDIALVLSRYVDGIMARVFGHQTIEDLAEYSRVPVINGLSDLLHPCQALGDLLTVLEKKREFAGLNFCFIGDGNNVAHSLINACAGVGMNFSLACPEGLEPEEEIVQAARGTGIDVLVTNEPEEAAKGADILYTDVWASMGEEDIAEQKKKHFQGFTIDERLLARAATGALVMHCLPAHYGEEITQEVAHGPQSAIFDQAENRMHAQKALLALLMS